MPLSQADVFIIDDDALIRDSLEQLVKSVGLKAESFSSVQAFLAITIPDKPICLVSDIRMPNLSGLELQDILLKKETAIPIIFITGHGTVAMSVRAMKAGAVDFLQKPFEDQELLDAIHYAIEQHRITRLEQIEIKAIKQRLKSLTTREHQIIILVVAGMLNKQIAYALKMNENTVKSHRARLMRKMDVNSLAELVRATEKAGIFPPKVTPNQLKNQ